MNRHLVSLQLRYDSGPAARGLTRLGGEGHGANVSLDTRNDEWLAQRTRLAQELHDTLLQGFFAASMQLHSAVDGLPADSVPKTRLNSALLAIEYALEEGRLAVQGLRSSHADSLFGAGPRRCAERPGSPFIGGISSGCRRPAARVAGRAAQRSIPHWPGSDF